MREVRPAPWWTAGRLLTILGSTAVSLLLGSSWVVVLRRRVHLRAGGRSRAEVSV